MAELTQNEKRLLATMAKEKKTDAPHLAGLLEATPEAVVQWAHLLGDKGLVTVERIIDKKILPTEEGEQYRKFRLPETQIEGPLGLDLHPAQPIRVGPVPEHDRRSG